MTLANAMTFGGYLPLVASGSTPRPSFPPHSGLFSSGRACLAKLLREMQPARLHLPGFLCDSVYQPALELGIPTVPYAVDTTLLPAELDVPARDMVLFVDYFGLRTREVHARASAYGERAIVDRSQAWFSPVPEGCWSFDSARKFFGVPDGGRLHGPRALPPSDQRNTRYVLDHLVLGALGHAGEGLEAYRRNNALMHTGPERISLVGDRLLEQVDMEAVRTARTLNFQALHALLGNRNRLPVDPEQIDAPLYYPLLLDRPVDLAAVHAAGIFAPRLWPDVLKREGSVRSDIHLVDHLIPLPIDQRYTSDDMELLAMRLISIISVMVE